jgi:hypothetical protein
LRFRLRRPLGILTGTIDKLLIQPAAKGDGFDVEIIDFKNNRFKQSRVRLNHLLHRRPPISCPLLRLQGGIRK